MIALNLRRPHYQVLLITYLKFTKKNAKDAKKEEKSNQYAILLSLKIINYVINAKNVKKIWLKPINGLIKKFPNIHQFCNGDINEFVLLLRKGVYPYAYMDSWERFDETSLPNKKSFYRELYLEDVTNEDYTHVQKIFEELKLKNLGNYHDFYVQSDTLLLADVLEKFIV